MSKNLQSTTKLTEFAPLQPEEKQQGVGQFISKFFKLNKTGVAEQKPTDCGDDVSEESVPTWAANTNESSQSSKDIYQGDEGRIFPNVLKRISNLLAVKNSVHSQTCGSFCFAYNRFVEPARLFRHGIKTVLDA